MSPRLTSVCLMNIEIHNYLSASFKMESEPNQWDSIVILDSNLKQTDFVANYSTRYLYLRFDDVLENSDRKRAATHNDIEQAFAFAEESENLLVCCRAGQSRSAAIAFLIAHRQTGPDSAINILNAKRHIPNSLIIDIGTSFVIKAMQTFQIWQDSNKLVRLADFYDEIELELDALEANGATNRIIKN